MSRFQEIVDNLHLRRLETLEESRKKRRKGGGGRKKKETKLTFESDELNKIFNEMPEDMRKIIRGK